MFARFRNLFSKSKNESDVNTKSGASCVSSDNHGETLANVSDISKESSKLEGLNLLKSLVESEKQGPLANNAIPSSLSEEVEEILTKRLLKNGEETEEATKNCTNNSYNNPNQNGISDPNKENFKVQVENLEISTEPTENSFDLGQKKTFSEKVIESSVGTNSSCDLSFKAPSQNVYEFESKIVNNQNVNKEETDVLSSIETESTQKDSQNKEDSTSLLNNENISSESAEVAFPDNRKAMISENLEGNKKVVLSEKLSKNKDFSSENFESLELSESNNLQEYNKTVYEISPNNKENASESNKAQANLEKAAEVANEVLDSDPSQLIKTESKTLLNAPKTEELNNSHKDNVNKLLTSETNSNDSRANSPEFSESSESLSQSSVEENLAVSTTQTPIQDLATSLCNNSSIVVEDLPAEITTPSPTVESTISGGSSNTSTLDSSSISEISDPSKIIVNPIDNNGLACSAITNKLTDIAEIAESLDAVIRDVQENVQTVEVESNPNPGHKKLGTLRSASTEDWHSRSTEDDSFATASEGNFTPSSSSFQTASGRTSSYISCDKNSFDASEADDSTYVFEMPELTSPLNMSFEGSEQSYLSAQPLNGELTTQGEGNTPTKLSDSGCQTVNALDEDQNSIADIEDLHSESVTPTPEEHYDGYHVESIPVESETELEVAGIVDARSMNILTENTLMPISKTPEVSPSTSNVCSNQNPITTQTTVNEARDSNDQQEQHSSNTNNNNKPNAAWRRSKYYENITKQTIKGFL